jgi:hypothetical protein
MTGVNNDENLFKALTTSSTYLLKMGLFKNIRSILFTIDKI